MKHLISLQVLILLLCFNFVIGLGQEETTPATPLKPGEAIHQLKIGVFGGANYPLSPSVLVNKPTSATKSVQNSLLNGFDGLNYGLTYNFGIVGKYQLSEKLYLGTNIEYSGWESTNSCNCNDTVSKSENKLTLLHFGIFSQYFLFKILYVSPEISLNFLGVKVIENSNRGNLDFSKSYPRIGAGLGVGYEIQLTKKFALDISAKGQFPNILLRKENSNANSESESLINSKNETKEAMLFILSFNIGILFSL